MALGLERWEEEGEGVAELVHWDGFAKGGDRGNEFGDGAAEDDGGVVVEELAGVAEFEDEGFGVDGGVEEGEDGVRGGFFFGHAVADAVAHFDEFGGLKGFGKGVGLRCEDVSNCVSFRGGGIVVGGVFNPGDLVGYAGVSETVFEKIEERTEEAKAGGIVDLLAFGDWGDWLHATEATPSGPRDHAHKDCFGLIVGVMSCHEVPDIILDACFGEELISVFSGDLFESVLWYLTTPLDLEYLSMDS